MTDAARILRIQRLSLRLSEPFDDTGEQRNVLEEIIREAQALTEQPHEGEQTNAVATLAGASVVPLTPLAGTSHGRRRATYAE